MSHLFEKPQKSIYISALQKCLQVHSFSEEVCALLWEGAVLHLPMGRVSTENPASEELPAGGILHYCLLPEQTPLGDPSQQSDYCISRYVFNLPTPSWLAYHFCEEANQGVAFSLQFHCSGFEGVGSTVFEWMCVRRVQTSHIKSLIREHLVLAKDVRPALVIFAEVGFHVSGGFSKMIASPASCIHPVSLCGLSFEAKFKTNPVYCQHHL